jgi:hypothetical protein
VTISASAASNVTPRTWAASPVVNPSIAVSRKACRDDGAIRISRAVAISSADRSDGVSATSRAQQET